MKSLVESLFDSKIQTAMESLFDKDLVQKNLGTLGVIVACIENFLAGKTTKNNWVKCLEDMSKSLKYSPKGGWNLLARSISNTIKKDELYVCIDTNPSHPSLLLMARGLIGDREFGTEACPLTVIRYSDNTGSIYVDIYRTGVGTADYQHRMQEYKGQFQWYKLSKEDVNMYIDNVFTQIDQVF